MWKFVLVLCVLAVIGMTLALSGPRSQRPQNPQPSPAPTQGGQVSPNNELVDAMDWSSEGKSGAEFMIQTGIDSGWIDALTRDGLVSRLVVDGDHFQQTDGDFQKSILVAAYQSMYWDDRPAQGMVRVLARDGRDLGSFMPVAGFDL